MTIGVPFVTFASIRRSRLRQCVAILLFVLVALPFTAPFATFDNADLSSVATVADGDAQKLNASSQDSLVASLSLVLVPHSFRMAAHVIVVEAEAGSRQPRRAVLRL